MKKIEINSEMLQKFANFTAFVVMFKTKHDDWFRVFSNFENAVAAFNKFVDDSPSTFQNSEIAEYSDSFEIENAYGSVSCELVAKILE